MTPVVEASGLVKRFGDVRALDGLDLVAEPGRVVALLGPNGAGKTTFVRSVATLVRPDGGTLRVDGVDAARDPARVRRLIGLAGQYAAVEAAMTGRENLEMVARLFGQNRRTARASAAAVLARLSLDEVADRLVRTYSGGTRRRLDLGASLVGAPRLLLLDEPTTGLDPRGRIELWDAIGALVADGANVLLTTQYLDEADRLADRVVIIDGGRVAAEGTPRELKSRIGGDLVEVHVRDRAALAPAARALEPLAPVHTDPSSLLVTMPARNGPDDLLKAVRALADRHVPIEDITLRRPTLDEVFLTLTTTPDKAPT
ncbi:daunorubicin resistance protein DrrA family ABC transporter ATP-binding protein [Actinomadura luteofluorescens]|uniref:ATP-binding cassette domain-containing protein n=1 Tax=Actinomadura luteofluorescens TaxID=46163 RepID=UPI00216415C5|nr:ATP-binding cassette domain-containing protein [Actinomadura glauciflava]MCR3741814.1 ABC-2 type transport system ATP-binding protein [Actinomadura glauciflava]